MKQVLILEDDVQFVENFDEKFFTVLDNAPLNWDMILLNGTTTAPLKRVNDYLSKTTSTWGAFAYVLSERIYDRIIEVMGEMKDRSDGYFTKLQPTINAYLTNEKLVLHKKGFSFIAGFETDHKHLR
jgi:GR25 family glycosyltransferase involved in LPS biosynthesis